MVTSQPRLTFTFEPDDDVDVFTDIKYLGCYVERSGYQLSAIEGPASEEIRSFKGSRVTLRGGINLYAS